MSGSRTEDINSIINAISMWLENVEEVVDIFFFVPEESSISQFYEEYVSKNLDKINRVVLTKIFDKSDLVNSPRYEGRIITHTTWVNLPSTYCNLWIWIFIGFTKIK